MVGQHARRLTRHYALLLCAVAVPLLLLVIALAVQQFPDQRRALLDELAGQGADRADRARARCCRPPGQSRPRLAGVCRGPAGRADAAAEGAVAAGSGRARHANGIEGVLPRRVSPARRSAGADRQRPGRPGRSWQRSPAAMRELDTGARPVRADAAWRTRGAAAPLELLSLGVRRLRDHVPVRAERGVRRRWASYASHAELIAGWLGYDVFLHGTPARDPRAPALLDRRLQDAGGAGPMVSHAAPVYADDRFMGVVGTDILLAYLGPSCDRMDWPVGEIWIVGDAGEVLRLAAKGRAGGSSLAARRAARRPGRAAARRSLAGTGGFHEPRPVISVLAEPLQGDLPFSLLYARASSRTSPA